MNGRSESFTPLFSNSLFIFTRNPSSSVMSALSSIVPVCATGAAADAGDAGAGEGEAEPERADASLVASSRMIEPSLSLSPVFTLISRTVPESGAGTSIVALSDSSAINGSSAFTLSPDFTKISMTGTSLNSPMSGTRTSATPAGALTGDGGALTTGRASASSAPAPSNRTITAPSLTLSPTFTTTDLTTPSRGDGTSMVALSDSSATSGSSAFTLSPGLTKISITGTSLKSPMSGTLMSIRPLIALSFVPLRHTVQGAPRPVSL